MTLETAKRIVEERRLQLEKARDEAQKIGGKIRWTPPHLEAEAVVNGRMMYCDHKKNGGRVYLCLKVEPTETDEESSTRKAVEEYLKRRTEE